MKYLIIIQFLYFRLRNIWFSTACFIAANDIVHVIAYIRRAFLFFGSTWRICSFIFSRRPVERTARFDNLSPIITQPAVARARQNFLTRWAYIYHSEARGWVPLSRPVPSRGRPSFPFNKSLQFFTLLHKRRPPACSCAFEGSGSPPLERKSESRAPLLTDWRKGRSDFSRQTRVKLPVYYGNAPGSVRTDYDFSCDNSIITPDLLRSVEHFWYSSGRRLATIYSRCA